MSESEQNLKVDNTAATPTSSVPEPEVVSPPAVTEPAGLTMDELSKAQDGVGAEEVPTVESMPVSVPENSVAKPTLVDDTPSSVSVNPLAAESGTVSQPLPAGPAPLAMGTGAVGLLQKARQALQARKRKKLDKILALAQTKASIGNDDIEKLLRVSDSTAARFLKQLAKEGRLKSSGKGAGLKYQLIK